MYSGGSGLSIDIHFVDIELSYDVLSPLPTLLSKHFNHPHPYIEIATTISDTTCIVSQHCLDKLSSHSVCVSHACVHACRWSLAPALFLREWRDSWTTL